MTGIPMGQPARTDPDWWHPFVGNSAALSAVTMPLFSLAAFDHCRTSDVFARPPSWSGGPWETLGDLRRWSDGFLQHFRGRSKSYLWARYQHGVHGMGGRLATTRGVAILLWGAAPLLPRLGFLPTYAAGVGSVAILLFGLGLLGCRAEDSAPTGFSVSPDDDGGSSCRINVERASCTPTPSCRVETYRCSPCDFDARPSSAFVVRECALVDLPNNIVCTPNCGQD